FAPSSELKTRLRITGIAIYEPHRRAGGSRRGALHCGPPALARPWLHGRGRAPPLLGDNWEMITPEAPGVTRKQPGPSRAAPLSAQGKPRISAGPTPRCRDLHHLRGHQRDPAPGDRPHPVGHAHPLTQGTSKTRVDQHQRSGPPEPPGGPLPAAPNKIKSRMGDQWEIDCVPGTDAYGSGPSSAPAGDTDRTPAGPPQPAATPPTAPEDGPRSTAPWQASHASTPPQCLAAHAPSEPRPPPADVSPRPATPSDCAAARAASDPPHPAPDAPPGVPSPHGRQAAAPGRPPSDATSPCTSPRPAAAGRPSGP